MIHHHILDAPGVTACISIQPSDPFTFVDSRIYASEDHAHALYLNWSTNVMRELITDPNPLAITKINEAGAVVSREFFALSEQQKAKLQTLLPEKKT